MDPHWQPSENDLLVMGTRVDGPVDWNDPVVLEEAFVAGRIVNEWWNLPGGSRKLAERWLERTEMLALAQGFRIQYELVSWWLQDGPLSPEAREVCSVKLDDHQRHRAMTGQWWFTDVVYESFETAARDVGEEWLL